MNQILNIKNSNNKIVKFLKLQIIISIILIICGIIYIFKTIKQKERNNNISNIVSINAKLKSIFSSNIIGSDDNFFCRIICKKIGLDYYVYNNFSEENLKILPCKFSGGKLNEDGNICFIGHNYYDERFFSNINKLEIGDTITIVDLTDNLYEYTVYKKYEIDENDTEEVMKTQYQREITLCTCTFNKEKRFVIKCYKKYNEKN